MQIVRKEVVNTFKHSVYPLDLIKRDVQQSTGKQVKELFNLMLDVGLPRNHYNSVELSLPLELLIETIVPQKAKFDLSFHFSEVGIVEGQMQYRRDKFPNEEMQKLFERLQQFLASIDHFSQKSISKVISEFRRENLTRRLELKKQVNENIKS